MSLLKKLLIPLSSVLISTSAFALGVGDKLPDFSNLDPIGMNIWYNEERTIYGNTLHYDLTNNGYPDFSINLRDCDGRMIPFAVYDWDKELLYVDNAPRDTIIDKINKDAQGSMIHDEASDCGYNI